MGETKDPNRDKDEPKLAQGLTNETVPAPQCSIITEADIVAQKITDKEELDRLRGSLGLDKGRKREPSLYDINEVDGGYEAILPGLTWAEKEAIMGTTRKLFKNREEAEQAVEQAKERTEEFYEKASLQKTFSKYFFRIDETPEGKFRVALPGLVDSKAGRYVGTTYKEFGSWKDAKEYFLEKKEDEEKLAHRPLLEVQVSGNEKIAFEELDAFNPIVAPSEKSHEIPDSIKKYLMGEGRLDGSHPSASTYQETIKEKDWEGKLFTFVSEYFKKDGTDVLKELGVKHLDALTPEQAVELATRIVVDLTKYKFSDAGKREGKPEKTKADQSTVLQLLKEGQSMRGDANWEGNGICRNFASSVKAVFEALKAKQTKFSRLRDTYCLYESGSETFAPKRKDENVLRTDEGGHAWNTFVTISREGAADAVIIDTTWAKKNLETKRVEGLDYTLTRMEPVVNAIGEELKDETPEKEEQLKHILSFYAIKMELPGNTGGFVSPEEEKQFYASRALELMKKQGVPQELPKRLVETIGQEYLKIADNADRSEIETIYKIFQKNPDLDFRGILRNYLKGKQVSDYHARLFIFVDDNLQREVFEELKSNKNFDGLIKGSPEFRARMRSAIPELFSDFSPGTKPEDAAELKYLLRTSGTLHRYESMVDARNPSEEKDRGVFEKIRQSLRAINQQKYNETVADLDDYNIIRQYDRLYREMKG